MSDSIQISNFSDESPRKVGSFWINALTHIWHDKLTLLAAIILFLLTLLCFGGPPIVENILHVDVEDSSVRDRYLPPSADHILGTDQLGRDQLIRLLYGGRISLLVAYIASLLSITIGLVIGILAGYFGGFVDDILVGFISILTSIPSIFLLLIATTIFAPTATTLIMVLGLIGWLEMARLIRGQALLLKQQEFVLATRALGSSHWHIMLYHILPNVISIALIAVTISAGTVILTESGLSFLGLGVQPPTPTWGNMLSDSRAYFSRGIHLVMFPGTLITVTVLCFFLLGDGLRDALDPRSRR